jgi:uncharacterized protein (TIGR02271 family)
MSHTVIGIFKTFTEASVAKQHLENNGFSSADVDVNDSNYTAPDYDGNDLTGGVTDVTPQADSYTNHDKKDDDSIGGFFRNLFGGGDDDDEDLTNRHIEAGKRGTVVTVHARTYDEAERAADILDEYGAVNVNDSDDWSHGGSTSSLGGDFDTATTSNYSETSGATPIGGFASTAATDFGSTSTADLENTTSAGYVSSNDLTGSSDLTGSTTGGYLADDDLTRNTSDADSIKVVEENLEVGKREVQTGGVRLRSRIVERPVEESVRLRQERVTVTRTPVDRPASDADFNTFQEGTVEMTESAEVPVVSKDARVVEEISLNKEVTEADQIIVDTVRHTEVDTENIDPDKDRNIL